MPSTPPRGQQALRRAPQWPHAASIPGAKLAHLPHTSMPRARKSPQRRAARTPALALTQNGFMHALAHTTPAASLAGAARAQRLQDTPATRHRVRALVFALLRL